MENSQFKIGDVVVLKSGGPTMTVTGGLGADGRVACAWFLDGKVQSDLFPPDALEKRKERAE